VIRSLHARALGAIDAGHVVLAVAVWVVLTAGSLAIVLRVVLALPADYFEREPEGRMPWTLARVARNLAGLLLIAVGGILSVPGIPGQGLLTMLVGVLLVDFPQRRKLERALLRRPGVLPTLNRLRGRFGRPPLLPPR
jgi:hypothetical protein